MVYLLLDDLLRRIDPHAGDALGHQGLHDVLHAGKAGAHLPPEVAAPVELLELFFVARLFKVAGGPENLGALDARPLQHLAHELRLVAVHADGLEVAAVDGHGLQQGLEGGCAAVGQVAPGDGGRDSLAGVGEVGGTGEKDGVHLPLGLEGGGHLPRLLVKFRAVVDELHVRQIPLGYIFNNVDRDRRTNHANFHRNNSPFRRLKT